ncbi:Peptidase family M48 [Syntrophus gentianae]|uniref:Peptidase family M48 n=1 Tax=Syntrophus gentianae TaxID=43775 RepID=A0A1H7UYM6_9BACT|nr:M48 family metallopeptidase [Syntrophus gentianae]SEM02081.1 Peptidase family M48 [Syntrophus gentianae]
MDKEISLKDRRCFFSPPRVLKLNLIAGLILTLFLLSCAEVPLTGRSSLSLVSDSQVATMGYQQYADVLKKSKLSNDAGKVQMVRRVGGKIANAAESFLRETGAGGDIALYKWEFNLIEDDKTVNAWCMPGGKVAVYTGILPITRDETGLAVVVGHEVAHAIAKHGNERMSQALLVQLGGIGLSAALSTQAAATQELFLQLYGVGSTVGYVLPYSRLQENEADRIGLVLMAKAGYDPRAAVTLWQRMNAQGGGRSPEFLSTHPAPTTRIANIQSLIPEAMRYYRKPQ